MSEFNDNCNGENGFEELRSHVEQGDDFSQNILLILQTRIEAEMIYSKSLSKAAKELNEVCRKQPAGSIAEAWYGVYKEMKSGSDVHGQLSVSLNEELIKPLGAFLDSHSKTRKAVENNVDKAERVLSSLRILEGKAKKTSHTAASDNEKQQNAMLEVQEKEIKSAEKDCAELANKRKSAEETVNCTNVQYYKMCVCAERARINLEMTVQHSSTVLQKIENQRLVNMKDYFLIYMRLAAKMQIVQDGVVLHLQREVNACDVEKDMQVITYIRLKNERPSEQLLPDFYCEHTTMTMNRKPALSKLLQLVTVDLEGERRSRIDLKEHLQSLNTQEYANIIDKLYHTRSMITYFEGARFKLHSALLELDHQPGITHPLSQHIQIKRDHEGMQQIILKLPLWRENNDTYNPGKCSTHDKEHYYETETETEAETETET